LEGGTKDEIRIFEALFKDVSTQFGLRTIEKCFENPDFIFCSSFQNLRLGSNFPNILTTIRGSECKEIREKASLCSPNEDFGRSDKHFSLRFRSTFQRFV